MDVQQQIFGHTQAINDLTNLFLQQLAERDNQIAALVNERNSLQQQLSQHNNCQHLQSQVDTLNNKVSEYKLRLQKTNVKDTVHNDQTLNQFQNIVSKNGRYTCKMQEDGNLVCYEGETHTAQNAFWASNTGGVGQGPFRLVVQNDGNVVVYQGNGQPTWASNTWQKGSAPYKLVMQNDRNLVLYDANNQAQWASNTNL